MSKIADLHEGSLQMKSSGDSLVDADAAWMMLGKSITTGDTEEHREKQKFISL
ncbi:MAG TPA: hypothetical protein VGS27_27575 [Candidatus Sulfotelmatobacter sp.]|nr:hypothetical protein [Candidatus Sulfotelmatobacter sp.]